MFFQQHEAAIFGMRILVVLAIVAVVAFAINSRLAFLVGGFGCILVLFVPRPLTRADFSQYKDAYLRSLMDTPDHVLFYSAIGALVGCGSVILLQSMRILSRPQFSIRKLLLVTTAFAVGIGVIRWFS